MCFTFKGPSLNTNQEHTPSRSPVAANFSSYDDSEEAAQDLMHLIWEIHKLKVLAPTPGNEGETGSQFGAKQNLDVSSTPSSLPWNTGLPAGHLLTANELFMKSGAD